MPEHPLRLGTNINWDRVVARRLTAQPYDPEKPNKKRIPQFRQEVDSNKIIVATTRSVQTPSWYIRAGFVHLAAKFPVDSTSPSADNPNILQSHQLLLDESHLIEAPELTESYPYILTFSFHQWLDEIDLEVFRFNP